MIPIEYPVHMLMRPGKRALPGRRLVVLLGVLALILLGDAARAENSSLPEVAGVVRNEQGEPIANAWVTNGSVYAFTDQQGVFVFSSGKVIPGNSLTISSPGYSQDRITVSHNIKPIEIVMDTAPVRGIYFNPLVSNTPEAIANFIEIAHTTDVNAVVIDIKDNVVYFNTGVADFQNAGMVMPVLHLPTLLQQFRENGIYTIARLVVFKDSAMAQQYPEYAVRDAYAGGLWRDQNGAAWINPLSRAMWDANIDLAAEAISLGFDEVQYDYIRFPTDGDLSRADFGRNVTETDRETAVTDFLARSRSRIIPLGGRQSADVFGYTTVVENDLGIGQKFTDVAASVDYISPMIYPSHWPDGSLNGVPGHPNDYPYLTVQISMEVAMEQMMGNPMQLRPWLQDFGMPGLTDYGVTEVEAQIQALYDVGISSWLIWSPDNIYHTQALKLSPPAATPMATPVGLHDRSHYRSVARTWSTVSH